MGLKMKKEKQVKIFGYYNRKDVRHDESGKWKAHLPCPVDLTSSSFLVPYPSVIEAEISSVTNIN